MMVVVGLFTGLVLAGADIFLGVLLLNTIASKLAPHGEAWWATPLMAALMLPTAAMTFAGLGLAGITGLVVAGQ